MKFAKGDELLASVIELHLEYIQSLEPRSCQQQGIDFYVVGHNASHVFYLGVKDGEIWKHVFGESATEMYEDGFPKIEEKTYKSDGFGYCGHF